YRKARHPIKIIHLKRDIRAISLSKKKWQEKYKNDAVPLLKILYRSFKYRRVCNEIVSLIPKEDVINIRYEDIFDRPEAALDSLAGFIGLKDISVPEFMELRGDHTIGGTPNR